MQRGGRGGVLANGWYDMWTYENPGSGYFLANSQFFDGADDFGTLGETKEYKLING